MPPKIKDLLAELERYGFANRGGKGSHRNYEHPSGEKVTISGNVGRDAKSYQIRIVKSSISKVKGK
jgi:predicted RNA binding protein YcfA (HicA-like mRNA interferase family)